MISREQSVSQFLLQTQNADQTSLLREEKKQSRLEDGDDLRALAIVLDEIAQDNPTSGPIVEKIQSISEDDMPALEDDPNEIAQDHLVTEPIVITKPLKRWTYPTFPPVEIDSESDSVRLADILFSKPFKRKIESFPIKKAVEVCEKKEIPKAPTAKCSMPTNMDLFVFRKQMLSEPISFDRPGFAAPGTHFIFSESEIVLIDIRDTRCIFRLKNSSGNRYYTIETQLSDDELQAQGNKLAFYQKTLAASSCGELELKAPQKNIALNQSVLILSSCRNGTKYTTYSIHDVLNHFIEFPEEKERQFPIAINHVIAQILVKCAYENSELSSSGHHKLSFFEGDKNQVKIKQEILRNHYTQSVAVLRKLQAGRFITKQEVIDLNYAILIAAEEFEKIVSILKPLISRHRKAILHETISPLPFFEKSIVKIIDSYLEPDHNFFDRYNVMNEISKQQMIKSFREGMEDYDSESMVNAATQLLAPYIPERELLGLVVGKHKRASWSLETQLPTILRKVNWAESCYQYIYFAYPSNQGRHSTVVVISRKAKEIWILDPKLNTLMVNDPEQQEISSQLEAVGGLERAKLHTPFADYRIILPSEGVTAIQGRSDNINCSIHGVMIITGLILHREAPEFCPDDIRLDIKTGLGITCKDHLADKFLVTAELAREHYATRLRKIEEARTTNKRQDEAPSAVLGMPQFFAKTDTVSVTSSATSLRSGQRQG